MASSRRSSRGRAASSAAPMHAIPEHSEHGAGGPFEATLSLASHTSERTPMGAVPLCLDTRASDYQVLSPFRSNAGVGLALPGTKLSTTLGM